jgi:hypothetical protein
MAMTFKPYDIGIWFENIDVNALSDVECAEIAHLNIDSDEDLSWLISKWIRPRFQSWNEQNRKEMIDVLEQSKSWSIEDIQPVVDEFQLPSGQKIDDIERFMGALRAEFLK